MTFNMQIQVTNPKIPLQLHNICVGNHPQTSCSYSVVHTCYFDTNICYFDTNKYVHQNNYMMFVDGFLLTQILCNYTLSALG